MTEYRFIEPVDVLYLRGNKLFGGPGDHGEALMPPWPSTVAGSLRTLILSQHGGISFSEYRNGSSPLGAAADVLGTPDKPGSFRISQFCVAIRTAEKVLPLFPPPADLFLSRDEALYARPASPHKGLSSSFPLPQIPVVEQSKPSKAEQGIWLNSRGVSKYLKGERIEKADLIEAQTLWQRETRLGITLSQRSRSTEKGRIYTSDVVAMNLKGGVGFLASIQGVQGLLPDSGVLRFGGDGRSALFSKCDASFPEPNWDLIKTSARFKILLTTPGLFADGWLPPGSRRTSDGFLWEFSGIKARMVSACLRAPAVVSGWDLFDKRPKKAFRAVPVGSVYFFEALEGQISQLGELVKNGLWDSEALAVYGRRRPEGFNNIAVACWHTF